MPEGTDPRPAPAPRPGPTPAPRPTISQEQFDKLVARINASSSLPDWAKAQIIQLVALIYHFPVPK